LIGLIFCKIIKKDQDLYFYRVSEFRRKDAEM
jgi:hypothetical protein